MQYFIISTTTKVPELTVNGQLGLFVDFVQANGLGELSLRADGAWITFFVDPFNGERMDPWKAANLPHFAHHRLVGDGRVNVGDEDLPARAKQYFNSAKVKLKATFEGCCKISQTFQAQAKPTFFTSPLL